MKESVKKHFYEDDKFDGNELAQELKFNDEYNGTSFDKIKCVILTIMMAPKDAAEFLCILFDLNIKVDNKVKNVIKTDAYILSFFTAYVCCFCCWLTVFLPFIFLCGLGGGGDDHYY